MLGSQILAGSIPACAGEPARWPRFARSRGVYPRVCGERRLCQVLPCRSYGSSPRVRGTGLTAERGRDRFIPARAGNRFIPARAGNGARLSTRIRQSTVHPRACGERKLVAVCSSCMAGSSPRVRGTAPCLCRFIPARAGNGPTILRDTVRACGERHRPASSVHPRACGERYGSLPYMSTPVGSSPRVRGTVEIRPGSRARPRFIPARAGNGRRRITRTVHPRACGERCWL